jgi:hypothetical protein
MLTALSYPSAANTEMPLSIRPKAVENIGTFCCTATVTTTNNKKILPLGIKIDCSL